MSYLKLLPLLLCVLCIPACNNKIANESWPYRGESGKTAINEGVAVEFPDFFINGISFYPEHWPEEQWDNEFSKMQEAGFNVVRMGEYAWSLFEPSEGQFEFSWMDLAIDKASKYGIKTILGVPTANVPPWLRKQHPDVLGGNSKGDFTLGARKGYNVNSNNYLKAAKRIAEAMAKHYGNNPNIIGWQLDNEPGYPFELYDDVSLKAFHNWLKIKYKTLNELNKAWGGAFWNLNYSDWDEIEFPTNPGDGGWNPGQKLDYRRFFSDAFANHLAIQSSILRKYSGSRFIFTNWPNMYWSVDPFEAGKKYVDATGWDNYSVTPGLTDYRNVLPIGLNNDIARCTNSGQRFLIAERQASLAAHAPVEALRTLAYLDLAHGSFGNIYFEWRPPLFGQEQGYESFLRIDGSFGANKELVAKMNHEFARLFPKLKEAKTFADIAMIYSYPNEWEQGIWKRNGLGYDDESERYYKALKTLGRNIDVIPEATNLEKYKIIAAPNLSLVSEQTCNRLENFVANGGTLIINKGTAIKDTLNRYEPLLGPGKLAPMAGVHVVANSSKSSMSGNLINGVADQLSNESFFIEFNGSNNNYEPLSLIEKLEVTTAKSIAVMRGRGIEGCNVVTVNNYKKGMVVYVGTDCNNVSFYEEIIGIVNQTLAIEPILRVPAGMEVVSRSTPDSEYIFVLNYTRLPQTIILPERLNELISNLECSGNYTVEPLGVALFERKLVTKTQK
jgi:beta-galactosidase